MIFYKLEYYDESPDPEPYIIEYFPSLVSLKRGIKKIKTYNRAEKKAGEPERFTEIKHRKIVVKTKPDILNLLNS